MSDLGDRVYQLRKKRSWTQYDLATVSGVSIRCISQTERGRVDPTLESVYRLALALSVPPADLLALRLQDALMSLPGIYVVKVEATS
jgi:transcriptional regulator with XRE-family HTH domain